MRLLAATFALSAPAFASHAEAALARIDVPRLLHCIALKEGHKWEDPGGRYQITFAVWRENTHLPYRFASSPEHADAVAVKHLRWIAGALANAGIDVNPYTLAGCWRHGFEGFRALTRRQWSRYGVEVRNLYRE